MINPISPPSGTRFLFQMPAQFREPSALTRQVFNPEYTLESHVLLPGQEGREDPVTARSFPGQAEEVSVRPPPHLPLTVWCPQPAGHFVKDE